MDHTDRLVMERGLEEERGATSKLIAGAGFLLLACFGLLWLRAGSVVPLHKLLERGFDRDWIGSALAVSVVVGATVLAVAVLSAFARGVQSAPYMWLGPALVGFSSAVLTRMPVVLPLHELPSMWFAPPAGLLLLAGGALLQMRGWAAKTAGVLLLSLPLCVVAFGYAQALPAVIDTNARLFLFILALTSVGVALLSQIGQSTGALQYAQLAQAFEHARACEQQARLALRRAQIAEHHLQTASNAQTASHAGEEAEARAFAESARPRLGVWTAVVFGLVVGLGAVAAAYVGIYAPLQKRIALQQASASFEAKRYDRELGGLRQQSLAAQAAQEATLAAERTKIAEALAAAEQARAQALAAEPAVPAVAADKPAPTLRKPKTQVRAKQRALARKAASRPRRAAQKPSASPEPTFDRATRRALRDSDSNSNDPLGGLDGM